MTQIGIFSNGLLRLWTLPIFLDCDFVWRSHKDSNFRAIACWGKKPSSIKAIRFAKAKDLPCWYLEDGFLRSYNTGDRNPPMSLVIDELGIYYDSTQPSSLELLLVSDVDLLAGQHAWRAEARGMLLAHDLSKYNHASDFFLSASSFRPADAQRVLVIDQTVGDMSVVLGGASAHIFPDMLATARAENPHATIYVKTHPEVTSGRKGGYLTHVRPDDRTVLLRDAVNPMSLLKQMDKVYVVTSTMGFEALLAGKPVVCFGVPWYAGWGVTDDRCIDSPAWSRRTRRRSIDELFAAAYIHYTRYIDPATHKRGMIFDVIHWLIRQRAMADRMHGPDRKGRVIGVGFRHWKAANIRPMLGLHQSLVQFTQSLADLITLRPQLGDTLVCWGAMPPKGLPKYAKECWTRLLHVEDGFIRSVGLGSDLIRPLSLVLDEQGIYFDPSRPSDLENILNTGVFTEEELAESLKVRDFIVTHGITKYNLEPRNPPAWQSMGREIILVPGQVEDDASIRLGCPATKTNLGLLQAVRAAHPDAFIVYKPHPDVVSRNRKGRMALKDALAFADHVETEVSVVSCIEACDVVHTMTSLTGFDALLRGKRVVVHGLPFYAGWGLTEDVLVDAAVFQRRQRRLCLDELVVGVLLRYPIYWDWDLKGYTTCEAVLNRIVETRSSLEASGGLQRLRAGFVRRQLRKLGILLRAYLPSKLERWVSL